MTTDIDPFAGMGEPGTAGAPAGRESPELVYGSAQDFLINKLLPSYIRVNDGKKGLWCPEWYKHSEAIARINALWRTWEHFRQEGGTGMSVWWKDHADHHMSVLYDPEGPFHSCTPTGHYDPKPIQIERAPEGWFQDVRLDAAP